MFGMGFMEIFLVLIVAIVALGPEKLPSAAVDMVKFFKKIKGSIDDAKSSLDNELNITQMKNEADKFKASINEVKGMASLDLDDLSAIEDNEKLKKEKTKKIKPKVETESKIDIAKKENISYSSEGKI